VILSSSYDIVIIGLTITSSWGNGHATTYRGLMRELVNRDHHVLFLERDMPWYAAHRDLAQPPYGKTELYSSFDDLKNKYTSVIQSAELVIVGSFVPDGIAVGEWVTHTAHGITAFYDIDTPVTLSKLLHRECEYISPDLIHRYDLYLSFAGGPILSVIEESFGSPMARPLYCSVDPEIYFPEIAEIAYDFGYMGTYSQDRQEPLERLLLKPARKWRNGRFIIAGPQYPKEIIWPENVKHIDHIPPSGHRRFYCSQNFTLNITRADMVQAGYAPSVRLFEAAACGTPVISDYWEGLNTFFQFGDEILLSGSPEQTLRYLKEISSKERMQIGERARKRVLSAHTAVHRAEELECYFLEARRNRRESNMSKAIYKRA
jgi:spore maturation protein CgeB